eukprot:Hpha_TRINITY_DN15349_c2_g4::TRINITY_DN15349_c2_g4_i1::g.90293::m.90293
MRKLPAARRVLSLAGRRGMVASAAVASVRSGGLIAELKARVRTERAAGGQAAAPHRTVGGERSGASPPAPSVASTSHALDPHPGEDSPLCDDAKGLLIPSPVPTHQHDAGVAEVLSVEFDPELGYLPNLHSFPHHRQLYDLLRLRDAPFPPRVHEDILNAHGKQDWSAKEAVALLEHCHVVLRGLRDLSEPPPQPIRLTKLPNEPPPLGDPDAARMLHDLYESVKEMWGALWDQGSGRGVAARGGCPGWLPGSLMLRCTSVTGDTETAKAVFNAAISDRSHRYKNTPFVNGMIWTHAEAGDMAACTQLWDAMLRHKKRPDIDTYEALLHCAFRRFEMPTVIQVWKEIKKQHIKPRATTFEMVVNGCVDCRFFNHAWRYYYEYKDEGFMPSPMLQMRMGEIYTQSIKENARQGSKIIFPVDKSPHLNYKMLIDFCRIRSIKDVVMPEHVAGHQSHYIAAVEGENTSIGTEVINMMPKSSRTGGGTSHKKFTTHGDHPWLQRGKGATNFIPPGARDIMRASGPPRKYKKPGFDHSAGTKKPNRVIHDFTGRTGRGPWVSDQT